MIRSDDTARGVGLRARGRQAGGRRRRRAHPDELICPARVPPLRRVQHQHLRRRRAPLSPGGRRAPRGALGPGGVRENDT
jgi:hypothetical protein